MLVSYMKKSLLSLADLLGILIALASVYVTKDFIVPHLYTVGYKLNHIRPTNNARLSAPVDLSIGIMLIARNTITSPLLTHKSALGLQMEDRFGRNGRTCFRIPLMMVEQLPMVRPWKCARCPPGLISGSHLMTATLIFFFQHCGQTSFWNE